MSSVHLRQVIKQYESGSDRAAVNSVDLEIPDGELFVLLGPSGCGKSTLLKMIAGLEEPTSGGVWIGDRLVNYMEPGRRNVAMVFQNYALYPHMTVEQNIRFPLRMRKVAKGEANQAVAEVCRRLDLAELLARPVAQLSGGQRQRVAVARALVREPDVMLMDEPLSNLDALLRVQLREELIQLHSAVGGTVVYVTHDQVEAMTMGDRIGVMNGGDMVQVGTPGEVYESPANRFVAGFIGAPPMNFVAGLLEARASATVFTGAGLEVEIPAAARIDVADASPAAVVLGVRPEAIALEPAYGGQGWTVQLVENLGWEQIITCVREDTTVRARVRATGPVLAKGEAVGLGFDASDVHLFDAITGESVMTRASVASSTLEAIRRASR